MKKKLLGVCMILLTACSFGTIAHAGVELTDKVESDAVTDTEVSCTIAPQYLVTVPKRMSGTRGHKADYDVHVQGDIPSSSFVVVEPIDSDTADEDINFLVYETAGVKGSSSVQVVQERTLFTASEIAESNGSAVSGYFQFADDLTAGEWKGTIEYHVEVVSEDIAKYAIPFTLTAENCEQVGVARTGDVIIPETFEIGNTVYKVTAIDDNTFRNCTDITSCEIPNTVMHIGVEAFYRCEKMATCEIPIQLQTMGKAAFKNCSTLKSVNIPGTLKTIPTGAFAHCSKLTEVELNEGIEIISDSAFAACKISSLVVPEGVTSIGTYSFNSNSNLKSVILPDTVVTLGAGAFSGDANLESIKLSSNLENIQAKTFLGCKKLNDVNLPNGLTKILGQAFAGCTNLECLVVPDSVYVINYGAFQDVPHVHKKYVTTSFGAMSVGCLPDTNNVCTICGKVCGDQRYVILSEENRELAGVASSGDIIIPKSYIVDGVTYNIMSVGNLFRNNKEITSVTINEGVQTIATEAFYGCANLQAVYLPDSCVNMGVGVFQNCTGLKEFRLSDNLTSIRSNTFLGCTSLTEVTIPENINTLEGSVFQKCSNLKSVTLSTKLGWVDQGCFAYCASLEEVDFSVTGVSVITASLFQGCTNLKSMKLRSNTSRIDNTAFANCTNLVLEVPTNVSVIYQNAFKNVPVVHYFGNAIDDVGNNWGAKHLGHNYVDGVCSVCGKAE